MLSPEFITEQKNKLLEEKTRLESELNSVADKSSGPDEYQARYENLGDDQDSNALEVGIYEQDLAVEHDLHDMLDKVEAALNRIDKGTYGQCRGGDEIEEERLRIVPWADACVKHS